MTVKDQRSSLDTQIAETLKQHHARMVSELDRLSAQFAAVADDPTPARRALADWIDEVLVPHAEEEEQTSYRAASALPAGRLLIDAMVREHVLIRRLVSLFKETADPVVAATYGRAVFEVFESHQRKENEIILPLLTAEDSISLDEVMSAGHHTPEHHDHH